jgi:hypothetical protein
MGFWGVLFCSCSIRMVRFSDALFRAPGACHFHLQLTRFCFRDPSRRCLEFLVFLCVRNIRRDEARSNSIVYVQRPNAPINRTSSAKIHVAIEKNLFLPFAGHVHRRRVGFHDAPYSDIRGAQTAFILFSTFPDLRPVSAANDLQTSINGRLEIRISKSKTPV